MWTCEHCGTQNIAPDLTFCPGCFEERTSPADETGVDSAEKPEAAPAGDGWGKSDAKN